MASNTSSLACCSVSEESNCTCKSAPVWADVVRSSTTVPVYPCTAARVTIDSVSSIITAKRLTDSEDPEPFSPLLISETAGDQDSNEVSIRGPAAPILPRTKAPPIHRKNGPKRNNSASTMKFEIRPPEPIGPKPPLLSIQLSA